MVSRDPRIVVWFRRAVLHRAPVLQHFEIHLTDHCNLNCKGCSHFSNLCSPAFVDLSGFETDMRAIAGLFSQVRHIYLLGGEPLLHPEISAFIRLAREIFPDTRIQLLTNGTLVTRMPEEFWLALAETGIGLQCDSYPIELPRAEIESLAARYGALFEWTRLRDQFRKTPIDPAGCHDPAASFASCQGFCNCPIVRNGQLYPCAYTAYSHVLRDHFGIEELATTDADSIALDPAPNPEDVMHFLQNPVPWCGFCDMESRTFYAWERSSKDMHEWIKEPALCADGISVLINA
ncbi:MAG: radical SAM protein [Actinomycetota bacterium]|jgi:hypothetical protein|nr:radical SAM protein [Actinomycetota bacterium]